MATVSLCIPCILSCGNNPLFSITLNQTRASRNIRRHCRIFQKRGIDIEVHHIVKVREDETRLLDNLNLICLCKDHHEQADNNEIDKDYLIELARKREQGNEP